MMKSESFAADPNGEKFLQSIKAFASSRVDKIQKHIEETLHAEIDKQDKLMRAQMRSSIERGVSKAKSEVIRTYAAKEQEAKKALLLRRQEIRDAVFAEARLKLQAFTETEEYQAFLSRCAARLADMFTEPDTVFFVKEADLAHAPLITAAYQKPCAVQQDRRLLIGGLLAESASLGVVADLSLDSMLEAQQPWFEKTAGLEVV